LLEEKLEAEVRKAKQGKGGISRSLNLLDPSMPAKAPSRITLVNDHDYSSLNDYNAQNWRRTERFVEEGNSRVDPFEQLLLETSKAALGNDTDRTRGVPYVFEHFYFVHLFKHTSSPSYATMIGAFAHPMPSKVRKGGKLGDFSRARLVHDPEVGEQLLRDKELLNNDFMEAYDPQKVRGDVYVRLDGVISRLTAYRQDMVNPSESKSILIKSPRELATP